MEKVKMLQEIVGCNMIEAQQALEMCGDDIECAIDILVRNTNDDAGPSELAATSSSAVATDPVRLSPSNGTNKSKPPDSRPNEEEHKLPSMPQLGADSDDDDAVRAPMIPTRETMIDATTDNFRIRRRNLAAQNVVPLRNFQIEAELQEASLADEERGHRRPKRPRLEDLFRPPVDICISGSLNTARECAQMKNRWLIINVQDDTIFESQTLNRDVWNNAKVKSIIKKLFLFWQVGVDNPEGHRCKIFYKISEFPYVAIVDPRTGENKFTFADAARRDATNFKNVLYEFVSTHQPYPTVSKTNLEISEIQNIFGEVPTQSQPTIIDATEEDQLRMAIQNSLRESQFDDSSGDSSTKDTSNQSPPLSNESTSTTAKEPSTSSSRNKSCSSKSVTNQRFNPTCSTFAKELSSIISIESEDDSQMGNDVILIEEDGASNDNSQQNYEKYLGSPQDESTTIILRLPDGRRDMIQWPHSTKLQALKVYVIAKYPELVKDRDYKLLASIPPQDIQKMANDLTLKGANLHPSAIVHFHHED